MTFTSKTTIINLVTGKATKTEGVIKVNGEVVNDLSKSEISYRALNLYSLGGRN